jgi:glycosyltransferase involved in cell wall biosynthesis
LAGRKEILGARLVYEVNGFPSVELKYLYPRVTDDDLLPAKLAHQEKRCLEAADLVVTVSRVSRDFIAGRGCPAEKIRVIPNGVDPDLFPYRTPGLTGDGPLRLLYVGTLSPWQGVETLLRALALVKQVRPVELRLLGPAPKLRRAEVEKMIRRLGLEGNVSLLKGGRRELIAPVLHESQAAVVPLLALDRNTQQGCCPLKLLEAMFAGCPVVASDLPVVRELAEPETHFLAAAPGVATALADAILRLGNEPDLGAALAARARAHVSGRYTWAHATDQLLALYESLLSRPANKEARRSFSFPGE